MPFNQDMRGFFEVFNNVNPNFPLKYYFSKEIICCNFMSKNYT